MEFVKKNHSEQAWFGTLLKYAIGYTFHISPPRVRPRSAVDRGHHWGKEWLATEMD